MKFFLFPIVLFFVITSSIAQSITQLAFNNGGGYSATMEWSIGESVSIASFSSGKFNLNTGVLQPISNLVIDVIDIVPSLSEDQVTIGPNPTSNHLYVKTRFGQAGKINLKIHDLRATLIYSDELDLSLGLYNKDIQLQGFASGTYFLTIYFKPVLGTPKRETYKIIKL